MDLPLVGQETERPCISTGHLPAPEAVRKLLFDAGQHSRPSTDEENPVGPPAVARCVPSTIKNEGDT
jgi:glutaminase